MTRIAFGNAITGKAVLCIPGLLMRALCSHCYFVKKEVKLQEHVRSKLHFWNEKMHRHRERSEAI